MPRNYDRIDFYWSWNGDYLPGPDGDILTTEDDRIDALRQSVADIIRSELGDWQFAPYRGANISDFIGEANTRETANQIEKRLRIALTNNAGIADGDLTIKIKPLTHERIIVMLAIQAMPTQNNSLDTMFVRFLFVYSFGDKGLTL